MERTRNVGLVALFATSLTLGASAHIGESEKLLPSDGAAGDEFGTGVDIDGTTAVVGAPFHQVGPVAGAVYVFQRSTYTSWPQVAKLTPSGAGPLEQFGSELALDGTWLAVGAPGASAEAGAVYVFQGAGASWSQTQVLTASDAGAGHLFGQSLELDGDTLVVGAAGNEAAYVFRLVGGVWSEEQKLTLAGGSAGDLFGRSVSVLGDELVVGAPFEDTDALDAGSVYLFERSGSTWTQMTRFGSATPGIGDAFGFSACIGTVFVGVGAPFDDDAGADSGAAHYFSRNGTSWVSEGTLTSGAAPTAAGDQLGESIAVDTKLFVIGQPLADLQGSDSGGTQTYLERLDIVYGDVLFPSDTTDGDRLGASTAISGCWMMAGAPQDDDLGADSGSAYVFLGNPPPTLYCLPGINSAGCASTLSATGLASASEPSGFTVTGAGVNPGITGLFFYGKNGAQQVPWGNGTSFQCVVPPVKRLGLITSTGAGLCGGTFTQDLNATWCPTCPGAAKNPGAGEEIYLQLWYRDPGNTSNQKTALSNAASIAICP